MEIVLIEQAHLPTAQAMLVVNLARTSKQMFSATTDFTVTQEFADAASYEERLALAHCLFAVAGSDERISAVEEAELHRITNQLRIEGPDLRKIRLLYRPMLPGFSPESKSESLRLQPAADAGVDCVVPDSWRRVDGVRGYRSRSRRR